jgi:hypothetical protein
VLQNGTVLKNGTVTKRYIAIKSYVLQNSDDKLQKRYSCKTVQLQTGTVANGILQNGTQTFWYITQYITVAIKRVPPTHGLVGLQPNLT